MERVSRVKTTPCQETHGLLQGGVDWFPRWVVASAISSQGVFCITMLREFAEAEWTRSQYSKLPWCVMAVVANADSLEHSLCYTHSSAGRLMLHS
jgi:hypothetical protein